MEITINNNNNVGMYGSNSLDARHARENLCRECAKCVLAGHFATFALIVFLVHKSSSTLFGYMVH